MRFLTILLINLLIPRSRFSCNRCFSNMALRMAGKIYVVDKRGGTRFHKKIICASNAVTRVEKGIDEHSNGYKLLRH